jgi:membrane protease YdiL (CAAX protease family)
MSGGRSTWVFLIGTIVLANILWFVTFYLTIGVFWVKISISASLLAILSLLLMPERREQLHIDLKSILIGLASAVILYFIFWAAKEISALIFPFAEQQIGGVYAKGEGSRMAIVFLLLFFVTGPSEELYWRGYIQDRLMKRFGGSGGFLQLHAHRSGCCCRCLLGRYVLASQEFSAGNNLPLRLERIHICRYSLIVNYGSIPSL